MSGQSPNLLRNPLHGSSSKWSVILPAALLFGCVVLLLDLVGVFYPVEFVLIVAFGWLAFLFTVVPNVTIDWGQVTAGLVAALLLVLMAHRFAAWFYAAVRVGRVADAAASEMSGPRWNLTWTIQAVLVLVCLFAAGTAMIGVTHQVAWLATSDQPWLERQGSARRAVMRNQSLNTVRMMALGNRSYHQANQTFLPGCTVDGMGRPLHGWQTLMLPYIEEQLLFDRIDLQQPWNSPRNVELFQADIGIWNDRSIERFDDDGFALTSYSANQHVMSGDQALTEDEISDGTGKTLLLGEINDRYPAWGAPTNWRDPQLGLNRSPSGFGSHWPGGVVVFAFADGHSQLLTDQIDPKVLRALSTPAGDDNDDIVSDND